MLWEAANPPHNLSLFPLGGTQCGSCLGSHPAGCVLALWKFAKTPQFIINSPGFSLYVDVNMMSNIWCQRRLLKTCHTVPPRPYISCSSTCSALPPTSAPRLSASNCAACSTCIMIEVAVKPVILEFHLSTNFERQLTWNYLIFPDVVFHCLVNITSADTHTIPSSDIHR